MREAERTNAQAQLIGFDDKGLGAPLGAQSGDIPLYAPADGRILRVMQQSETTLATGTPIMEISNIANDLEVEVKRLSTDAVQVGLSGPMDLVDKVIRLDPFGTTQFSALGVEERRVNALIAFVSPPADDKGLGHGHRIEAKIVVRQCDSTLITPASALFRRAKDWAVFVVTDGKAQLRKVEIGPNNGIEAQVKTRVSEGDRVILYPSSSLSESIIVAERVINQRGRRNLR